MLFPFEPVTTATGAPTFCAKSSMSPTTGTPRSAAMRIKGSCTETPGLTTRRSAAAKAAGSKPPRKSAVSGNSARS